MVTIEYYNESVLKFISKFKPKEQKIMKELEKYEPSKVAIINNLTVERIRQVHAKVIRKMRNDKDLNDIHNKFLKRITCDFSIDRRFLKIKE